MQSVGGPKIKIIITQKIGQVVGVLAKWCTEDVVAICQGCVGKLLGMLWQFLWDVLAMFWDCVGEIGMLWQSLWAVVAKPWEDVVAKWRMWWPESTK